MQHTSDHPFERYIRNKMLALRRAPSDDLWERIASRQKAVVRRRFVSRLLVRTGILLGVIALLFRGIKCHSNQSADTMQLVQKSGALIVPPAENAPSLATVQSHIPASQPILPNSSTDQDILKNQEKQRRPIPFQTRQYDTSNKVDSKWMMEKKKELPAVPVLGSSIVAGNVTAQESTQPAPDTVRLFNSDHPLSPLTAARIALSQNPAKFKLNTFFYLPAAPVIRPDRAKKWQYGVAFSSGKLHKSGNWESSYLSTGLQVQYRLTKKIHLFGGLEWVQGKCRFDAQSDIGGVRGFSRSQFPFIPPFPQGPPPPPALDFYVQSHWNGLSIPLGVTLYRKSPYQRFDWVLRAFYKPQFALLRKNEVWAPLTSLDKQLFETKKQALRAGWIGAQAGLDGHLGRRLHVELTLNAEQALQPVNLEQVNYQAFSLRLAVFRR
ncbi:MAG: hypothetical protein IPL27_07580 [Lewinellaceae bacterium]|nr:hypothetical protein [Lewinellaceae bacterium]